MQQKSFNALFLTILCGICQKKKQKFQAKCILYSESGEEMHHNAQNGGQLEGKKIVCEQK